MLKKLVIVVPAYNEEAVIEKTTAILLSILYKLIDDNKINAESKILYVDDGSKDKTWALIETLNSQDDHVVGAKLAHNAGHQNALIAGVEIAKDSDYIVSIDADLQDDPNAIIEMVNQANDGKNVVFGIRNNRDSDTWFKKTTAGAFYKVMNLLGVESIPNHADFRLIDQRVIQAFLSYPEREMFLRGIFPQIGFKQGKVFYARAEREAGETKYPLRKMLSFAMDGITSFSIVPIKMIRNAGLLIAFISFLFMIWAIVGRLFGQTALGWPSIIISIWFFGGLQLVALGVIGEYIGRIFMEVKHRPRYVLDVTNYSQEGENV
ncbi:glycosyltransferase [Leuconostoc pseudomesenteroides]|uniref:glycosyltransferase family 2 protein n=1 Tax=Leuconostoc pseudomesenteroides TaxID=33968 RepID=UPI0021A97E75|nr:glycosyltransferase family 2 protein [Leuconostoc pseudomesenteroides]MCT4388564.1 glycosyltransferase [Leuconostoc pseudomesenteroides]